MWPYSCFYFWCWILSPLYGLLCYLFFYFYFFGFLPGIYWLLTTANMNHTNEGKKLLSATAAIIYIPKRMSSISRKWISQADKQRAICCSTSTKPLCWWSSHANFSIYLFIYFNPQDRTLKRKSVTGCHAYPPQQNKKKGAERRLQSSRKCTQVWIPIYILWQLLEKQLEKQKETPKLRVLAG